MRLLLILLILFQIVDAVFTRWAVTENLVREWNPFVVSLATDWHFLIIKISGALVSALVLWSIYLRFPKTAILGTSSVVAFYGLLLVWNSGIVVIA